MIRAPSPKTLAQCFENPREAKRILRMTRAELESLPAGAARVRECFNPPSTQDVRMHCLNAAGDFYGVESAHAPGEGWATYLNTGDTYAPTIIRWAGTYRVQSLGDFIETQERHGIKFE